MGRWYFIRHGQASLGSKNYDQLSELGMTQARLLGEYFKTHEIHFDQVICGSQVRHKQTAHAFLSGYQSQIDTSSFTIMKEFNEFNFEAIIKAYLNQHPDKQKDKYSDKALFHLLKASLLSWSQDTLINDEANSKALEESWSQFQHRVKNGLIKLQSDFQQKDSLIFTSGGPIAQVVSQILNIPASNCIELNLSIQNTAITQCVCQQDKIYLDNFNHLPHLQSPDTHTLRSFS
jgi:broad specificity phosphatase PhoE